VKILITGSAGHLGEALMRTLSDSSHCTDAQTSLVQRLHPEFDQEYRRRGWKMLHGERYTDGRYPV
jgi:nucleoside-diphosphate-sugar epimerase